MEPSPQKPTQKQSEVYVLIIDHVKLWGFQPSYSELARVLKISKKAVVDRLKQLEAKGALTLPKGKRERAIQLHYVRFEAKWVREKTQNCGAAAGGRCPMSEQGLANLFAIIAIAAFVCGVVAALKKMQ